MSMTMKALTVLGGAALGAGLLLAEPMAGADPSSSTTCQGGRRPATAGAKQVKTANSRDQDGLPGRHQSRRIRVRYSFRIPHPRPSVPLWDRGTPGPSRAHWRSLETPIRLCLPLTRGPWVTSWG